MLLDVKLKGLPNEELVQGYPGIPATWPRVAGTVEIRHLPANAKESVRTPLEVLKVAVTLFRTDSIVVPSHRPSVAASKRERSFLVTRQKEIYTAPADSDPYYALDVPFTLSLPAKKPPCASISLPKTLESSYHLLVSLEARNAAMNATVTTTYSFPVRVRRFDTLATFGTYNKPIKGEMTSSDHLVALFWSLPVSAYGPGDKMSILLQAQPNQDWPKSKKVKLKRLSVELVQITKYVIPKDDESSREAQPPAQESSSGLPEETETMETRTRLAKTAKEFTSAEQDKKAAIETPQEIELPVPSIYKTDGGILPKETPFVGYDGRTAFTNSSSLYSIEFRLVLKARFSHAKDIEAEQPITMSQFDHGTCMVYMNSLVEAAQRLKQLDMRAHPPLRWAEPLDQKIRIV